MNLDSIAAGIESAIKLSRLNGVYSEPSHEDLQSLFAALPFEATRPSAELHPHRAVLADALREKGRDQEADRLADPHTPVLLDWEPGYGFEAKLHLRPHSDLDTEHHGYSHVGMRGERDFSHLPAAVKDYLATALWSSTYNHDPDDELGIQVHGDDADGRSMDDLFGTGQFTPHAAARAAFDIAKFRHSLSPEASAEFESRLAGHRNDQDGAHTLWLTRNGHGVNFSDHDYEHADELNEKARKLGSQDVYHTWGEYGNEEPEASLHLYGGK